MNSKYCRDCDEEKPLTEFYRNSANKDGHGPYCKPCALARNRASYHKNIETRRARDRIRHARLPFKEYRRRHRDKYWLKYAHEKLVLRAKGAAATLLELENLWWRQGEVCALTGVYLEGVKPHLDHILPKSRSGADTIDNLRFVHPMANQAKGAKLDADFFAWLDAVLEARARHNDKPIVTSEAA